MEENLDIEHVILNIKNILLPKLGIYAVKISIEI